MCTSQAAHRTETAADRSRDSVGNSDSPLTSKGPD